MAEISPGILGEWSLWVLVIGVDNVVPNSVELWCRVVVLQNEVISTFVSLRFFFGVSVTGMKRLMDISIVVDKKSQSERSALISRVDMGHNGLVSKSVLGITTAEPGVELRHNRSDVLFIVCEFNI